MHSNTKRICKDKVLRRVAAGLTITQYKERLPLFKNELQQKTDCLSIISRHRNVAKYPVQKVESQTKSNRKVGLRRRGWLTFHFLNLIFI